MIARLVHERLDQGRIDHELIEHPPSTSAIVSAAGSHVPSAQVAKPVLVTISPLLAWGSRGVCFWGM